MGQEGPFTGLTYTPDRHLDMPCAGTLRKLSSLDLCLILRPLIW